MGSGNFTTAHQIRGAVTYLAGAGGGGGSGGTARRRRCAAWRRWRWWCGQSGSLCSPAQRRLLRTLAGVASSSASALAVQQGERNHRWCRERKYRRAVAAITTFGTSATAHGGGAWRIAIQRPLRTAHWPVGGSQRAKWHPGHPHQATMAAADGGNGSTVPESGACRLVAAEVAAGRRSGGCWLALARFADVMVVLAVRWLSERRHRWTACCSWGACGRSMRRERTGWSLAAGVRPRLRVPHPPPAAARARAAVAVAVAGAGAGGAGGAGGRGSGGGGGGVARTYATGAGGVGGDGWALVLEY